MLKEAIKKRYVGTMKTCQRVLMVKGCFTYVLSEAANIRIRASGFELAAPYTSHVTAGGPPSQDAGKVFVIFKKQDTEKTDAGGKADASEAAKKNAAEKTITPEDYVQAYRLGMADPKGGLVAGKYTYSPNRLYNVGYLPNPVHSSMDVTVFLWAEETAAQNFADAFNRLLYAAYQDEEFKTFSAAAKAWRENPVKPPLSPDADRDRVLAENALKEKNMDSAIEHYENALEAQPTWPAGWFNLALLYAEQKNYADATDRMRHYLELVPDAPDAKDAREQMIIWEDKAKH
jgi:tetratricopeptide (TPR) repeat protein